MDEQLALILEQYDEMQSLYGTVTGVNLARKHIGWYTKGLTGSAEFRNMVNQEDDPARRDRQCCANFTRPGWPAKRPDAHSRIPRKLCFLCNASMLGLRAMDVARADSPLQQSPAEGWWARASGRWPAVPLRDLGMRRAGRGRCW